MTDEEAVNPNDPAQTHDIPKLEDILNDSIDPESAYSKLNFLKFLIAKHCIENYECYTELQSLFLSYDKLKNNNLTSNWIVFYNTFIAREIVNLPADVVCLVSKNCLPSRNILRKMEKILINFLYISYYEFVSINKQKIPNRSSTFSSNISTSSPLSNLSPSTSLCSECSTNKQFSNFSTADIINHHRMAAPSSSSSSSSPTPSRAASPSNESAITVSTTKCSNVNCKRHTDSISWSKISRKFSWQRRRSS